MKERGVSYFIDKHVTFKADYVHIREEENRLICSLEGEFLKDGESYDPPMSYSMINLGVTTRYPIFILAPVYYSLLDERELRKK